MRDCLQVAGWCCSARIGCLADFIIMSSGYSSVIRPNNPPPSAGVYMAAQSVTPSPSPSPPGPGSRPLKRGPYTGTSLSTAKRKRRLASKLANPSLDLTLLQLLLKSGPYTLQEMAEIVGLAKTTVVNAIKLLRCPEDPTDPATPKRVYISGWPHNRNFSASYSAGDLPCITKPLSHVAQVQSARRLQDKLAFLALSEEEQDDIRRHKKILLMAKQPISRDPLVAAFFGPATKKLQPA